MAVSKSNNFNGGTNGTTISVGNSGGASGDAFNTITGTPKFSSVQKHGGSGLSMENAQGASWSPNGASWTFPSENRIYFRAYIWIPIGLAIGSHLVVASFGGMLLSILNSGIQFDTSGGTGVGVTNAGTPDLRGRFVRLEATADASPPQQLAWRLFSSSPESDVPIVSVDATGATTPSTGVGLFPSTVFTNAFLNTSVFMDDVAISTTGWIGPSGAVDHSLSFPGFSGAPLDRLATAVRLMPGVGGAARTRRARLLAERAWSAKLLAQQVDQGGGGGGGISTY